MIRSCKAERKINNPQKDLENGNWINQVGLNLECNRIVWGKVLEEEIWNYKDQ